ncbi:MAG: hypothetical protein UY85_C0082G0003 [Candidatus Peribacteria bacterium GW2011_GWB1_54_5]|nr:MAG: hypothetical protein UY85_C0082G0003 [Candidatus Peribacteria bacterium GW2011_GWB1_54_5]
MESPDEHDLFRKQELYALCVMRDFQRVITQFEIGRRSLAGEKADPRAVESEVLGSLVRSVNGSKHIQASYNGSLKMTIGYEHAPIELSTKFSKRELSLRYQ